MIVACVTAKKKKAEINVHDCTRKVQCSASTLSTRCSSWYLVLYPVPAGTSYTPESNFIRVILIEKISRSAPWSCIADILCREDRVACFMADNGEKLLRKRGAAETS